MSTSEEVNVTPERINTLATLIQVKMQTAMEKIREINNEVRVLSVNARIEAARAGSAGRSFGVVASVMGELSSRTSEIVTEMTTGMQSGINELVTISDRLSSDVRGQRLTDLALNNIDLIDRNLYERTCDVRWWATDSSLVQACQSPDDSNKVEYAGQRMGIILDAYTVYFDLVLCGIDGRVLINGRPGQYNAAGRDVSKSAWFRAALASASGDEYGFEGVHKSELVTGKRILAYSCGVRTDGDAHGDLIGVLGILFNWDDLAQTIVKRTPISADEKDRTRVLIADGAGNVLADTQDRILADRLHFDGMEKVFETKKGFLTTKIMAIPCLVGHAYSPGYETYATGWHSLIIQKMQTV